MIHRIHLVVGARPNFMKAAPLFRELRRRPWCRPVLVHTGQHYDYALSQAFFEDLGMPAPDHSLDVGSASHAVQTAAVMSGYDAVLGCDRPSMVVVVGDVNSTLACALTAVKEGVPVAHLEAGLRSRDRTMPEEINRLVTDAVADRLWTPSPDADDNLLGEGVPRERIARVGNIMMDCFEMLRPSIEAGNGPAALGLAPGGFAVATLHRPSNVDTPQALAAVVEALSRLSERLPVVFPVHPRTRERLSRFGLARVLEDLPGLRCVEPMGYVDFMGLVTRAALVVTDSGGLQEETTYLGLPCLTVRDNTERPVTVTQGTNRLCRPGDIDALAGEILAGGAPKGRRPELWDGRAAGRVADDIDRFLHGPQGARP